MLSSRTAIGGGDGRARHTVEDNEGAQILVADVILKSMIEKRMRAELGNLLS